MKVNYLFPAIAALVLGCGGGTSGTSHTSGIEQRTYTGRLADSNGQPLADATVLSPTSEDTATTDEQGNFVLTTTEIEGGESLVVSSNDGSVIRTFEPETPGGYDISAFTFSDLRYRELRIESELEGESCRGRFSTVNSQTEGAEPEVAQGELELVFEQDNFMRDSFDQKAFVAEGEICELRSKVSVAGVPLAGVQYQWAVGGCTEATQGTYLQSFIDLLTVTESGETGPTGEINLPFAFGNTPGNCTRVLSFPKQNGFALPAAIFIFSEGAHAL